MKKNILIDMMFVYTFYDSNSAFTYFNWIFYHNYIVIKIKNSKIQKLVN